MKNNLIKILLSLVLLMFTFSCKVNSEKPTKPLSKDFIFIKGATIEGAIQAEGYTESPGFELTPNSRTV